MVWKLISVLLFVAAIANGAFLSESDFAPEDTIVRDVCIIGGGSTGTYAAIRLKEQGKSVAVVEQQHLLGGHTETFYLDSGEYFDYGVEGLISNELSRNYFRRLGVEWRLLLPDTLIMENVNFETGKRVPPPGGVLATIAAAILYRGVIEKYDYLRNGTISLPDPVPEELLRPFREFVSEHRIEGALSLIFTFCQNLGNLMDVPTIYIIQAFGIQQVDAILSGFLVPTKGGYELYRKAAEVLGADVLYNSSVVQTERSRSSVKVVVQDSTGQSTLIHAQKLLITIPPTLENLKGFDLDETETGIFQKLVYNNYYVAVLNHTGIPDKINVVNTNPDNGPGSLPHMPYAWRLRYPGVSGYVTSEIIGDVSFTANDATELILSGLSRMRDAGTYNVTTPELLLLASHSPATPMVSPQDIQDGFYRRMYGLQGRQNTFYTGRSFASDHSPILWAYTDAVIQWMSLA
ncbi:hypothetical protein EYZ11_007959 [Aspergillus tanneri]|uniref:Amine oxidase domain-containing protein n=1 Tax=Aspergillus tanneri TaxID=1220188 RepID=A0A4S3JH93_9EURO|nr:uncharacterized protein ATNIH1004_005182 [Aspergillus tanneri]KAA8649281.1 hypothetical protein ATNIH1004_005182 [Aspergillus tanneri]THC92571.1 hypothetical protein EYZ11_007959 [Aspergillus tanneri]